MNELQWLVDMILHCKLPGPVRDKFIARIGEVEASLRTSAPRPLPPVSMPSTIQAPSMQRIIDEVAMAPTPAPKRVVVPTEVITSTGNGTSTRGPRKF